MGEIVAAALLGHVPTVMLPEETRVKLGGGVDTTMVDGFARVRERLDRAAADTLVIFDTHWFTTTEHVVAGAEHHAGVYTSEELPMVIRDLAYDYAGAPALGALVRDVGKERGVRTLNATNPHIAHHYPTLNLVHHLHRGEQVLSVGICQTASRDDFTEFGAVLAEAIRRSDARVALLASGGMSHRFWPLSEILDHQVYDASHVITPEARAFDERILALWRDGAHAEVIDLYADYQAHSPEGYFGHYLMLVGALRGRACRAPGEQLSAYENSVGTGQVHVWFELPRAAEVAA